MMTRNYMKLNKRETKVAIGFAGHNWFYRSPMRRYGASTVDIYAQCSASRISDLSEKRHSVARTLNWCQAAVFVLPDECGVEQWL